MEFTKSLQDSLFIASIFIAVLFIICTVSLALRNYEIRHELKKLKKWRKFSEIEKKQKHEEYYRLATELAEEQAFNEAQGSMHVKLMLKYAAIQEESEKTKHIITQKETFITELKKEVEQYQDAVSKLQAERDSIYARLSRKNLKRDAKGRYVKQSDVIERDWTQASKDELLAEATRRYPAGTKVKGNLYPFDREFVREDELRYYDNCEGISAFGEPWVYSLGQWAKIIPNA